MVSSSKTKNPKKGKENVVDSSKNKNPNKGKENVIEILCSCCLLCLCCPIASVCCIIKAPYKALKCICCGSKNQSD